jgi:hypothetical protein
MKSDWGWRLYHKLALYTLPAIASAAIRSPHSASAFAAYAKGSRAKGDGPDEAEAHVAAEEGGSDAEARCRPAVPSTVVPAAAAYDAESASRTVNPGPTVSWRLIIVDVPVV